MNPIEHCPYPPGTIGIVSGELSRYTAFAQSMFNLGVPPGTGWYWAQSGSVAKNCNRVVEGARGDWIWFMGDDHTFRPDILARLLQREVDVVVPLCSQRGAPYQPVVFTMGDDGRYEIGRWRDLPTRGCIRTLNGKPIRTGQAGMLIKRHVFEKIPGPYWFELGQIIRDQPGEDLHFCEKVLAAGFSVYLDVEAVMGHMSTVTVRPVTTEAGWRVDFDLGRLRLRTSIDRDEGLAATEQLWDADEFQSILGEIPA